MIHSTIKTRIFDRFMRSNAPAALAQCWAEVRTQLGLLAVGAVVVDRGAPAATDADAMAIEETWLDVAPHTPAAIVTAVHAYVEGFSAICPGLTGGCTGRACEQWMKSGIPFRITRRDDDERCACCRGVFSGDAEGVIHEVTVIPHLAVGAAAPDRVLMFLSGAVLDTEDVRFLHTCAGLHFAQQALWDGGQRDEPAAALRPREIECVRWAVTGRTLAEIANVMGLSYRTVRFHLDSARARYGFSTNQQLFVQAAKDYGLDPDGVQAPARRAKAAAASPPLRRMQPLWQERRDTFDRRSGDRRQTVVSPLPFPDRRKAADRRIMGERRAVAQSSQISAESLLTPEEIRALLN